MKALIPAFIATVLLASPAQAAKLCQDNGKMNPAYSRCPENCVKGLEKATDERVKKYVRAYEICRKKHEGNPLLNCPNFAKIANDCVWKESEILGIGFELLPHWSETLYYCTKPGTTNPAYESLFSSGDLRCHGYDVEPEAATETESAL